MDKLREILNNCLGIQDCESVKDFIEEGVLDSIGIMDVVEALEAAFAIEISGRDIVPENFKSIESIDAMIRKYIKEV